MRWLNTPARHPKHSVAVLSFGFERDALGFAAERLGFGVENPSSAFAVKQNKTKERQDWFSAPRAHTNSYHITIPTFREVRSALKTFSPWDINDTHNHKPLRAYRQNQQNQATQRPKTTTTTTVRITKVMSWQRAMRFA